jgi:Serine dehydratase beta chain
MPGPTFGAFDLFEIDIGKSSSHVAGPMCAGASSLSVARTRHARIRRFAESEALLTVGHNIFPFRLSGLSPATDVADQTQERQAVHPILDISS